MSTTVSELSQQAADGMSEYDDPDEVRFASLLLSLFVCLFTCVIKVSFAGICQS